jgi:cobalt-zinc-cadmium efflux system outer membrane protein
LIAVALLFPVCALADSLTREQAVTEARAHNPEIRSLAAAIASARGDVTTAGKWTNPELTVAPGFRTSDAGGDQFHAVAELRQELLFPGKRDLRVAVAQKNVAVQELALTAFQYQLDARVRRSYDALYLAQRAITLHERRLALAHEFVAAAQKKVAAGTTSEFEATRAEADVVRAEKTLRDARVAQATARGSLNALLGREPIAALEVTDSTRIDFSLPDEATFLARVEKENPGLRVQDMTIEQAKLTVELERKLRMPDFTLGPNIEYLKDEQTYDLGVSLPLPLWDHRKGEIATATAEQERALAERDRLRSEILSDAGAAYASTAGALESLALFTPDLRARMNAAIDAAAQGYREGRVTLLTYIEIQRTFFEMQSDYIDAMQALIDARAALETAAGVSLESLIETPSGR